MLDCLITFRSVLPAQRAEGILHRSGIGCVVRRTPKWMERQGCGYSLRISCEDLETAIGLLDEQRVNYKKVYRKEDLKL